MSISNYETVNVIEVNNLGKKYQLGTVAKGSIKETLTQLFNRNTRVNESFWAINDVSFKVKKGEVLGIIGKNGAGKSTLLKILSRISYPTSGNVIMNGRVASLLEVGTGFHPELTGRENIFLNGSILGMKKNEIKDKYKDIIAFSGVEKFIDTPVKHYSSGMYVRLAFSVAAHLEPEILIIDEVLAVGDAEFQSKCLGKMKEVAGEGRTVLFVSHNMAAIQNLCTRVIFMENGKIEISGNPKTVIQAYLTKGTEFDALNKSKLFLKEGIGLKEINVSSNPDSKQVVFSGCDLIISLLFELKESAKLVIRLDFYNSSNELLFICNNYQSFKEFDLNAGEHKIECQVKDLPLYEGKYRIAVLFFKNKEIVETIDNALNFNVAASDFFGTGKISKKKLGLVLQRNQWEIKK